MAGKSSSGSAGKAKGSGQSRQHVKGSNNFYRKDDVKKIKKIKMLANGHKATRDRDGKILEAAEFQSRDAQPGMVQPDRRWFGGCTVNVRTYTGHSELMLSSLSLLNCRQHPRHQPGCPHALQRLARIPPGRSLFGCAQAEQAAHELAAGIHEGALFSLPLSIWRVLLTCIRHSSPDPTSPLPSHSRTPLAPRHNESGLALK